MKLEYLLYRGSASGPPFNRSPDFTETDSVPEAQFSEWGLRHRLMLDEDWSGDGAPDLVQIDRDSGPHRGRDPARTPVRTASRSSRRTPSRPPNRRRRQGPPRSGALSATEPAIICRTATGAVIFTDVAVMVYPNSGGATRAAR